MYSYKPTIYRHQLVKELEKFFEKKIEEITAEEVVYYFHGGHHDWDDRDERDCPYAIIDKHYRRKSTLLQRASWVIVVPLILLTLPFVWVVTGEWGYNPSWKISKVLHKITKL